MNRVKSALYAGAALSMVFLAGCEDSPSSDAPPPSPPPPVDPTPVPPPPPTPFTIGLLPDTQGGSDAMGQAHVAMHPMDEVLKHQAEKGVDMVLALGDLTDNGSDIEFAEWVSVAEKYAAEGIEFLPIMGNHETSYAYTQNWIANMKNFIPEDAVHMPGYEWVNYYVIRENVLIIGLAYYNLLISFEWIKATVNELEGEVDHIVVASHDGLIGAKYGQTLEQIVDGTKDDDWVFYKQEAIRKFFAAHDVIYVQGHEHQYQRSLVSAKPMLQTLPSSSTPTGGNYRMDVYTQIMSGNASRSEERR
ncbi:MAG: metallophosphoesterase, partial [Amphiplicatus sp.]